VIKAVFLDWFNTLARFEPPREELHSQALQESGIEASPRKLLRGLLLADRFWFEEDIKSKIKERSPEEQAEIGLRYQQILLTEAGVEVARELLPKIMKKAQELYKEVTFALFEDVLPTLKTLKGQKFILGLLTNLNKDMAPICRKLGLEPYLDFVVTSEEVGSDKPQPPIFLTALERAKVDASEAVHVGDQYKIDIAGARGVGISPILIDRYNLYPDVTDCPRISQLSELSRYLK
jgi:putative hydrolase of the HAD superfamily